MKGSDEKSWERKVVHWWCVHIWSRFSFLVEMFWKKGYWKTQKDQALTIHEKNEMKMILSMSGLQISETAKQCTISAFTNSVSTFWTFKIEWKKNIDEIMWYHYLNCKCQCNPTRPKTYLLSDFVTWYNYYQSDKKYPCLGRIGSIN